MDPHSHDEGRAAVFVDEHLLCRSRTLEETKVLAGLVCRGQVWGRVDPDESPTVERIVGPLEIEEINVLIKSCA